MVPKQQRDDDGGHLAPALTKDELARLGLTNEDVRRINENEAHTHTVKTTMVYSKTWTCTRCHRHVDCGAKCPECGEANCCE